MGRIAAVSRMVSCTRHDSNGLTLTNSIGHVNRLIISNGARRSRMRVDIRSDHPTTRSSQADLSQTWFLIISLAIPGRKLESHKERIGCKDHTVYLLLARVGQVGLTNAIPAYMSANSTKKRRTHTIGEVTPLNRPFT